jgi:ribosomal protein S18 acetylase RimI-like enzyme
MKEKPRFKIHSATPPDVPELAVLFDAYRVFYEAVSAPSETALFVHHLIAAGNTRLFIAHPTIDGYTLGSGDALGFVHLMPSINTVAMRPIWLLEDLYVTPKARSQGVASALMQHAEIFARATGAERLTLATAHDNLRAQSLYKKLGYLPENHFLYFHRMLD